MLSQIVCITWSIITHVAWLHVETGSLLNVFFVLSQNTLRNHISTTPITVKMCWRGFSGWDLLLGLYLLAYISVEPSNGVKRIVLRRATIKTRFHELDGCQASGKAKNDARRSVAIASLSSLFWYDKEYILEFIFRWKTTQGLVKNVIKSSILFVTKEWRGAVYFLFYVEQTRQACLNP